MFFPIGDTNVRGGYKPIFSYSLIVLNIIIFLWQYITPGHLVCALATIPKEIVAGRDLFTLITSMFLHGGWMHLLGNMLFLWVFADNIEAVVGNFKFIAFYLLGGLIASGVHIFFDLYSAGPSGINCCIPCLSSMDCDNLATMCAGYIPSLGASGAISAIMGAYIVLFPRSRIKMLFLVFTFSIPAFYFLGFWFANQLIAGLGSLTPVSSLSSGVAWWAHIGGFVFGLVYGFFNRKKMARFKRVKSED